MTTIDLADADETARLQRLRSLGVLDSAPEAIFDQSTKLAADLCQVPIALISLVDAQRQWFKSNFGLHGTTETARDVSFCSHACTSDALLEIVDASGDSRFAANPLVTGEPGIRFYAGAPIVMPQGERVGALCVIDRVPRQLTESQRIALTGLSHMVATALLERERRLALIGNFARAQANYRTIVEGQSELISLADPDGTLTFVNLAYARFFGRPPEDMVGRSLLDFVEEHDRDAVVRHLRRVSEMGIVASDANRMVSAQGEVRWVAWTNRIVGSQAGQGRAIHSVGRDITDQRLAEQALAQTEGRNRMLYESTPAMLHSIDTTGRLLNVSDTWLRTLGYERHEVIGQRSSRQAGATTSPTRWFARMDRRSMSR